MLRLKIVNKETLKMKTTCSMPPIIPANFQDKEVIPSVEMQTITPDRGFDGLSEVRVLGDEDLLASNIKKGVSIFGIDGSMEEMPQEVKEGIDNQDEIITTQEITIDNINQIIEQKVLVKERYKPRYSYGRTFYGYAGTELDYEVENLDTTYFTTFYYMFNDCYSLSRLNITHWKTSNVTDMASMFGNCYALKELDVSNFDTSKVTTMANMFKTCQSLTELDLSNFNTSAVTNMSQMFSSCNRLKKLDIRNFTFDKVTSYSMMFGSVPTSCLIIVKGDTEKQWITSKFTSLKNVKTVAELEV